MRLGIIITLSTGAIGLLLLLLGISGAWYVLRLQASNSQLLDANVESIQAAEEMEILVRQMRKELYRYLLTEDHDRLIRASEKREDVERWLEKAGVLSGSEQEEALVSDIQRGLDEFFTQLAEMIERPSELVSTDTVDSLIDEVLTGKVLANARQHLDLNEKELHRSNDQNKAMAERFALALLLLGTCGAVAGLVAGYGLARGISRSILQLSVPIRDVAGKLNEVVGPVEISTDPNVTDLEAVLQTVSDKVGAVIEQLQARHREVIRADQLAAVGQLAAGLAHELRNPLMCMKTLVQSARRQGDTAHLDSVDLRVLDQEITRLGKQLQAFLDFARPAKPETENVDLARVIRQTTDFLYTKAQARHATIECRLPDEPLLIWADATQLRQVLVNLLLNALDALQNGGNIWVDAIKDDDNKPPDVAADGRIQSYVRLRVTDNGQGLPADNRSRIYEPFFSTKETGLGLGLAISQRIIEAHGGVLTAGDREGGGAIFEILLPTASRAICET